MPLELGDRLTDRLLGADGCSGELIKVAGAGARAHPKESARSEGEDLRIVHCCVVDEVIVVKS